MICSGVWGARWEYTFNFQGSEKLVCMTISKVVPFGEIKVPQLLPNVFFRVQSVAMTG